MKIPLSIDNFVCRGSSLQHVDYVIGVVVYTGHDTKIMLNTSKTRTKKS